MGLKVDYYVLINLRGFETLVDALGGITVNVNSYVPIGGVSEENRNVPPSEYIEPGPNQKLDGRKALWFARGRYGSDDFARMGRQRCVINAIIEQANPANMLARYEQIAKAGKQIVITDIPQEVLPLLVDLSLRVQKGQTRSVLVPAGGRELPQLRSRLPGHAQTGRPGSREDTREPNAPPEPSPSPSPSAKKKSPARPRTPRVTGSTTPAPSTRTRPGPRPARTDRRESLLVTSDHQPASVGKRSAGSIWTTERANGAANRTETRRPTAPFASEGGRSSQRRGASTSRLE